ncbi:MAG: ATP-binding protein [Candidatus Hydrogenedentes bacterium]|nr:ATP-binding protein [Candidatus Hydrogenedentota bacterium]
MARAVREFPVVVLTGPRQSGKTTLLKHQLGKRFDYVSLETPDVRAAAEEDPRGFLELHRPPVILDEAHYAPNLLPYVKERVDADRTRSGQYVLSGSQNLVLPQNVTETLAGRAAILKLLPLSYRECLGYPRQPLPWQAKRRPARPTLSYEQLWNSFLRGGYPELVAQPGRDVALWHASYIQTYLERDIRTVRNVGDLSQFQAFLRMLAARSAQLLNLADLARDLGVAVNTAKAWLSLLEATYQVMVLRPYFANIGKRLVKSPKIYFSDVGALCYLVGLRDVEHARSGPMSGAILETAVVAEVVRSLVHQGDQPDVYFWRTAAGAEIDLVVDSGARLIPIEVKLSATPHPRMAEGIHAFRGVVKREADPGYVVHPGDVEHPLGQGTVALPFARL